MIVDETELGAVGASLADALRPGDVVTLSGGLGMGKTTLVRSVLQSLGHRGDVPSPSFALVQPYDDLAIPLAHADLYRLEHEDELAELGLDEVLMDGVLFVEWPERAGAAAWPQALRLSLAPVDESRRALTWQVPQAWEGRWPPPPSLR